MPQVTCRWCNQRFEKPPRDGRPKPTIVSGSAHYHNNPRGGRPKKAPINPEEPVVSESPAELWSSVVNRYAEIWARIKPEKLEREIA